MKISIVPFGLLLCLGGVCASVVWAAEAPTAVVARQSCLFLRGRDLPEIKQVMGEAERALAVLGKKCEGKKEAAKEFLGASRAIEAYQREMGFKANGEPDGDAELKLPEGYSLIPVTCLNYETELPREWRTAKRMLREGKKYPGVYADKCASKPNAEDAIRCMDDLFWEVYPKQKALCHAKTEEAQAGNRTQAIAAQYDGLRKSISTLMKPDESCDKATLQSALKTTLTTINSLGVMGPTSGVANLGVILGIDAIAALAEHVGPEFVRQKNLRAEKERSTQLQLFCAYKDMEYLAQGCDAQAFNREAKAPSDLPSVGKPFSEFYSGKKDGELTSAKKLIELLSEIQKTPEEGLAKLHDRERPISRLEHMLNGNIKNPLTDRIVPTLEFLKEVAGDLAKTTADEAFKATGRKSRTDWEAIRYLGTQLLDLQTAFKNFQTAEDLPQAASLLVQAIKGEQALDLDHTLTQYFELKKSRGYRDLQLQEIHTKSLANLTAKRKALLAGIGNAKSDIDKSFTRLWKSAKPNLMEELQTASQDYDRYPDKKPSQDKFDSVVGPLVRACIAFRGAAYYDGGTRLKSEPRAHFNLLAPNQGARKQFDTLCKPLNCTDGVPPFPAHGRPVANQDDEASMFGESQCKLLDHADEIIENLRRNYLASGTPCKPQTVAQQPEMRSSQPGTREPTTPKRESLFKDGLIHKSLEKFRQR